MHVALPFQRTHHGFQTMDGLLIGRILAVTASSWMFWTNPNTVRGLFVMTVSSNSWKLSQR